MKVDRKDPERLASGIGCEISEAVASIPPRHRDREAQRFRTRTAMKAARSLPPRRAPEASGIHVTTESVERIDRHLLHMRRVERPDRNRSVNVFGVFCQWIGACGHPCKNSGRG